MKILVVCGTNRDGALTRLLAKQVAGIHEQLGGDVDFLDIQELPADAMLPTAYKEKTPAVQSLVDRFLASDGVVFVIPEYNGSYPGILKLFIDMLPFPEGLDSRPCAFVGIAAGQFRSLRAVEHFQQVTGYRNAYNFPRRVFIGDSFSQFDGDKLKDEDLVQRLQDQSEGFVDFVKRIKS